MSYASSPELSVLHAVRVTGVADDLAVSHRTGIDRATASELLQDFEAYGWVTHVEFGDVGGWTLTERGRDEDSRKLSEELDRADARAAVEQAHKEFGTLNGRLVRTCTDWQLRPTQGNRLASNDHSDPQWDGRVLRELMVVGGKLTQLVDELAGVLARFGGYADRFDAALTRASAGDARWVAGIGIPSCHVVWMELHEDLLATLGLPRGYESESR
ncbi:transcriptional regulator [Nocardia sp. CNY236]|uniref:transcriptional regulator n=1 Tax=Nocardia sp. CNY236 TaxID=1169152 RepID=UPI000426DECE|nr:transcriptional regulator [Nocardia sp. CNY236]